MKLENLTFEERTKMFAQRTDTVFELNKDEIGFENIDNELSDEILNQKFELPPIFFDEKHLAQIVTFSGQDLKGKWIRIVVRTYMENGKVIYERIDKNKFRAEIIFNK